MLAYYVLWRVFGFLDDATIKTEQILMYALFGSVFLM